MMTLHKLYLYVLFFQIAKSTKSVRIAVYSEITFNSSIVDPISMMSLPLSQKLNANNDEQHLKCEYNLVLSLNFNRKFCCFAAPVVAAKRRNNRIESTKTFRYC
jgi:hypothetical protein